MAFTVGSGRPLRSASAIVGCSESGQHLLKIDGYSHTKGVPTESNIKSRSFRAGGHSWNMLYYPNGWNSASSDSISIFLQPDYNLPQGVRAEVMFSLLDHGGKPVPRYTHTFIHIFTDSNYWGFPGFIKRDELEKSEHLKDDCFTVMCGVTVTKEIQTMDVDVGVITPQPPAAVVVPPSDLHRHLGGLLATGEGADVMFEVDARTFTAHRCVLMARSPVLHDELSSLPLLTKDKESGGAVVVQIQDMESQDFEALLHYIYTDSLPEMKGEAAAMLPDLVAAANRYKMERLRLVCEDKLSELVNAGNVAVILAFAEEHHCLGLKEACLRFLDDPANMRDVIKAYGLEHLSKSELLLADFKDLIARLAVQLCSRTDTS